MNRCFLCCIVVTLFCSCASLTKTQLTAVNQFAKTSENFSFYPGTIVEELAEVRMKSSTYAANSFVDAKVHLSELDNAYSFRRHDALVSAKADITFRIIDKYAQSLLLLSSDKYATNLSTQAQAFGENIDSLITLYNSIGDVQKVPVGVGDGVSQFITAGGRLYIRSRQAREVKKFVILADTLISVMTANLVEFLQSSILNELIENERVDLARNYLSFLRSRSTFTDVRGRTDSSRMLSDTKSTVQNDEDYLDIKASLDAISDLRDETVAATKKLRIAHKKLKDAVSTKKNLQTTIVETQELYAEIRKMKFIIALLQKSKK